MGVAPNGGVTTLMFSLQVIAQQQEETSELVNKQSAEMLEVMNQKKRELEADLVEIQKEIEESVSCINLQDATGLLTLFEPHLCSQVHF